MRRSMVSLWLGVLVAWMTTSELAWAEPPQKPDRRADSDEDGAIARARAIFVEGAELAQQMRWGDALARFEQSQKLYPHAGTQYNIGICQRALGQYTRARASFSRALAEDKSGDEALAASTRESIAAYLSEIDQVLAKLQVTLSPAGARLAVDGRPLERAGEQDGAVRLIAGTRAAGKGEPPPAARFELVLDPGAHVFVVSRKGFSDAVVQRSVQPGSRGKLDLTLKRLPATLRVNATEAKAAVSVDGIDVGMVPVTLSRPPGRYSVRVRKNGFDSYDTDVALLPAERVDLNARLNEEQVGIHERWWFWTSIAATIATAVVVTYFVTRPEPERPPVDGGGLGWTVRVP